MLPLVDSHLDLAENVTLFGRDLTLEVSTLRALEQRTKNQVMVTLPELKRGGIAVAFATVTAGFKAEDVGADFQPASAIYHALEHAEVQALSQLDLYELWEKQGLVRILKSVTDLEHHLNLWQQDRVPGLVLLMEGADPILQVADLPKWWRRGLRMIGLTFGDTKYGAGVAGGSKNFRTGGLTSEGIGLLEAMAEQGFIWDISHLTETGVWQGLEIGLPRVCATHATARALNPTDRHLSDDVIRAVVKRGGVIGLVLYNGFLEPRWRVDKTVVVSLEKHVRDHAAYLASVAGWNCIGIGSDLDGGFGLEESPLELNSIADLYKMSDILPAEVRKAVLSTNWLTFLRRSLPRMS
jgi:membrane dipeptidase